LCKVEGGSVHADADGNIFKIPTGGDWITAKDVGEDASQGVAYHKCEQRPDRNANISPNEDAEVEE